MSDRLNLPILRRSENTVVMIHGAGGGAWEYDRWRPVFECAGWKVIAPDLMPASSGLANTTFADYRQQVADAIPPMGHVTLIGASLGGLLALKVAEVIRPDALVLINSVPPAGVGEWRTKQRSPPIVPWANGPLQETRDAMPDSDEDMIQYAHVRWRNESGAVLDAVSRGVAVRKPHCPTLVVLGEEDSDVPVATGLAIAKWAGADVHLYPATSHVGPLLGHRAAKIAEAARLWIEAFRR